MLASRHAPLLAACVAILLTLPSLRAGWIVDDHFHRAVMTAPQDARQHLPSKLDPFRFLTGDPAENQALIDAGFAPWWMDRDIKGAFWRPVTALTHWLDYQLWPDSPVLMHLHSVLWYGAVSWLIGLYFRRILGPTWIAGFAAFLYAMDDAHGMPVGFLANRNAIVAAFYGLATLILHDQWRRESNRLTAIGSVICFVISLLSSEAGLATTAYLFAYAVFKDRGSRRGRILSLVPYTVLVVAWRIAWTLQGYGVSTGMGLYIDPLTEPVAFVVAALTRIPRLLAGQWAFPPADASFPLDPNYVWVHVCIAIAVAVLIAVIAWPVLRRIPDASFWCTGMLLSVIPISATFTSDRLLGFVGIGGAALTAQFIAWWREHRTAKATSSIRRRSVSALAWVLVLMHVGVAPFGLMVRSAYPSGPQWFLDQLLVRTPFDESIRDKTLVIVNAPMAFYTIHLHTMRMLDGTPLPLRTRNLTSGIPSVRIERPDDRTLIVRPEGGFIHMLFDRLFRSPLSPMRLGDRIELTGLTIEVIEMTTDARPAAVRFTFDVPLDDPSLAWLFWEEGSFHWWTPPPVGSDITLCCDFPYLGK